MKVRPAPRADGKHVGQGHYWHEGPSRVVAVIALKNNTEEEINSRPRPSSSRGYKMVRAEP